MLSSLWSESFDKSLNYVFSDNSFLPWPPSDDHHQKDHGISQQPIFIEKLFGQQNYDELLE